MKFIFIFHLIFFSFSLANYYGSGKYGYCAFPFLSSKNICYKTFLQGKNYIGALKACSRYFSELMPISKLRYFSMDEIKSTDVDGSNLGYFRVNAIHDGKQWKQWINGKLLPLSFKYFPSFNSSSGNFGDSLMVHPMDTTQLFITPYYKDVMVGGNFKLFPLCYKDKTLTCKNHNYDCCDNGDCIYGKCSCYPGWSPETNCCAPSSCNATINPEPEIPILPKFIPQTRVFHRSEEPEFMAYAYQYGTSSFDGLNPATIIYPKSVDDVIKAVNYATENNVGIAVRTGGHQYMGQSSTSGKNIQLDLSDTFGNDAVDFIYIENLNLLRVGVSYSLVEFTHLCIGLKIFVPVGICGGVHLGGHIQTGGEGALVRSFGLLGDYVEGFEIVLASGNHVKIWKPNSLFAPNEELIEGNDDLFWAVMGGSPGNFGILTHVLITPLRDEDFPDSRMMKFLTKYTREKHHNVEKLMAEMSSDFNFPRNFDFVILILSPNTQTYFTPNLFKEKINIDGDLNLDDNMQYLYPEQYGDGIPWAEQGEGAFGSLEDLIPNILQLPHSTNLVIYAKWANINGLQETFGMNEMQWFDRIREACGGESQITDFPNLDALKQNPQGAIFNFFVRAANIPIPVPPSPIVDYRNPIPLSEQNRLFVYNDVREFNQPFIKGVYRSEKMDLSSNGYTNWIADRVELIEEEGKRNNFNINIELMSVFRGGNESMYYKNGANTSQNNAHSWRQETNQVLILNGYYDPKNASAFEFVKKWHSENDECCNSGGLFSNFDRRHLSHSYIREEDPDDGVILDTVWDKYYDSRDKYDRLIAIKRKFDPDYIFTANTFGVDASNAPEEKRNKITKKDNIVY